MDTQVIKPEQLRPKDDNHTQDLSLSEQQLVHKITLDAESCKKHSRSGGKRYHSNYYFHLFICIVRYVLGWRKESGKYFVALLFEFKQG